MRTKDRVTRLNPTWAHNLFVWWVWISYFGSFQILRLNEITFLSFSVFLSLDSLSLPKNSIPFPFFSSYLQPIISGGIIITFKTCAMRGPMLLIVSEYLGVSGFGNGSHYSKCARQRSFLRHCQAHTGQCDRTYTYCSRTTC